MTPSETVTAFLTAIERMDIEAAVSMLAEDISYENMPIGPIVGRDAVRQTLQGFLGPATEVDWPVSSQFAAGNRVTNERVDRFRIGDGWLELPVAGFFEVDEWGLITLWRDYFDMDSYTSQLAALTGGASPAGTLALQPIVYVADMAASTEWYRTLFGAEPTVATDHWTTFEAGDATLALHLGAPSGEATGSVELSLVVDGTLEEVLERTGWSAEITSQPFGRSLLVTDPDGTAIQVNEHG